VAFDWGYFWYQFKNSKSGKFLKLFFLAAGLFAGTVFVCFLVVANPNLFQSLGFRMADMSQAPETLIVRQGSWQQSIPRDAMVSVCTKLSARRARGDRGGWKNGYIVQVKTNDGRLVPVSQRFDSAAVAGAEAKKIADTYQLPMDVCF
jgi:hypothetical protein